MKYMKYQEDNSIKSFGNFKLIIKMEYKIRETYKRKEKLLWYITKARYGYICNLEEDDLNYDIIMNLDLTTDLHILEEWFIKIWKKLPMLKDTENDTIDEIFAKCSRLN